MTDESKKYRAILKRGMYFDYNGVVWNNHTQEDGTKAYHLVDEATKKYLEENAFEFKEVDGEDFSVQRFEFRDAEGEQLDDAPKPRSRKRPAAE